MITLYSLIYKIGKQRFYNYFSSLFSLHKIILPSVIYSVSYESEFCFQLRIILKNGKVGFVLKTQR